MPKRITFVAGTLGQGGAERQLFYVLKVLRQHGVELRLLCLNRGEFWEERIAQELKVPITWIGKSRFRLMRLARLIGELRRHPTDVLQSQHFYTNLYVAAAARILQISEVGAIRNNVISEVGSGVLGRWSLTKPLMLAANSRAALVTATGMGVPAERCFFLPNVVDTVRFTPGPPAERRSLRVIAVGRLVPQKRLERFVQVIAELRTASPVPIEGVIVGDGPLRQQLEEQARGLGLDANGLTFKGALANMAAEYQQADILALTSDFEGTPNVLLESMASGLPIVTTPVGGVPELVRDGETGLITPNCQPEEIKQALVRLLEDSKLRRSLGQQAREHVQNHHSLHALPRFLEALYAKAVR